jgi:hypothetical protein
MTEDRRGSSDDRKVHIKQQMTERRRTQRRTGRSKADDKGTVRNGKSKQRTINQQLMTEKS